MTIRYNHNTLPQVAVYAGSGASHSWIWFTDLFDREQYAPVVFVNEQDIANGVLEWCSVLLVSGGDTFAIAEALGQCGAARLEHFVRNGGRYIGSCAGAYLPLRSSLEPLNYFNFVAARIGNLARNAPQALQMPEKSCTEYGCRYVVHPVRGEVRLRLHEGLADSADHSLTAPLYGGPTLLPSEDVEVLATYDDFTAATEFLVDETIARSMIVGAAAAVRKQLGSGELYLFGPHFEHPLFPEANRVLLQVIVKARRHMDDAHARRIFDFSAVQDQGTAASRNAFRRFLSSVSTCRIMAFALERTAYRWRIGKKVYDPEKISVMVNAVFTRAQQLDASGYSRYIPESVSCAWHEATENVIDLLRRLKHPEGTSDHTAHELFDGLRTLSATFLTAYFQYQYHGILDQERRTPCMTITCTSRQLQHSTPCRL